MTTTSHPTRALRRQSTWVDEISVEFVDNVLSRAEAADVDLSSEDIEVVRSWFGARPDGVPDTRTDTVTWRPVAAE